ncbi:MAG: MarR family transcriptional regulator [candidate division WOR-3 bacterium]
MPTRTREDLYLGRLEWLGPILVRGLKLLSSVEAMGEDFSFSQTMVLQTLLIHREMRMNDLARFLGLTKANATGLVDRLVRRGLVVREPGVDDRRVVRVSLTRSGVCAARRLAAIQRQGLARMMRRIPKKNLDVFMDTLERVALGLAEAQADSRSRRPGHTGG